MIRILLFITVCIAFFSCNTPENEKITSNAAQQDTIIELKNDSVTLKVSLWGGAIVGFAYNDNPLNPLTWKIAQKDMPDNNQKGAPFQGHFLCMGRWGSPTNGEKELGIPHNGEPANNWWKLDSTQSELSLKMSTIANLEQYVLNRTLLLSKTDPCFLVTETFKNNQNCGRFTAIVQHATLSTPFLDEQTIISSNATYGFNQALALNSMSAYEYRWSTGYSDSLKTPLDLTASDHKTGFVSTHVIDDEFGWATAASPAKKLLIGYLWKTSDYPWLHIWHGIKDGKSWAKGIEFGTTGIGDTYTPEKRAAVVFHGRTNNQFMDAQSSIENKYVCFLAHIPTDFVKTESVMYSGEQITIRYNTTQGSEEIVYKLKAW